MPARSWYDAALGRPRPFGTEWEWEDCPVPPEMLEDIAEKTVKYSAKHDYGMRLSPSRLTNTPRQVIIDKFVDYSIDPESQAGLHLGTLIHIGLEPRLQKKGYDTETMLTGRFRFGGAEEYEVVGITDAHWPLDREPIPDHLPHIIELKTTSSGSMRFMVESGRPREEYRAQTSIYMHNYAAKYGIPLEEVRASVRVFCIPQKERLQGSFVRMPASKVFPIYNPMSDDELGAFIPGWSPPNRPKDYQGPPPNNIQTNARVVTEAFQRIKDGESVDSVVESLACMCDRKFNGTGREYCSQMMTCAMMDHGVPMW